MQTFVKINLNDIVYDKQEKVEGKVKFIDSPSKTAKIEVITAFNEETGERTTKLMESKLFNLLVVNRAKQQPSHDPNKWWSEARRFHKAFNHPTSDKPTQMKLDRALPRSVWTGEEALVEFLHASSKDEKEFIEAFDKMIEGLNKAKQKSLAMDYYKDGIDTIVAQADALTDAMYFILGSFVEMGIKPDKVFAAVQASNMSKLFDDGRPRYRESDGKIIKSENFFPPESKIEEEIKRQLNQ